MSEDTDDICGATKANGETCDFTPKYDDGRCGHHTETGENKPQGRKSKLTKERQESIASQIEQGKSINSAARMVGITPQTAYNWLDRGENEENTIYAEFFERITRAKGFGETKYFNTVWEIAKEEGDHRFLASLMKQRYPDSWGDTDTGVDAEQTVIELPESVTKEWERQTQ